MASHPPSSLPFFQVSSLVHRRLLPLMRVSCSPRHWLLWMEEEMVSRVAAASDAGIHSSREEKERGWTEERDEVPTTRNDCHNSFTHFLSPSATGYIHRDMHIQTE